MIGFLRGKPIVDDSLDNQLLIDVSGVGYTLLCSQNTIDDVSEQAQAFINIYTHVREDQITLFGFSKKAEKDLFLSLIKVNGIGPKLAIGALSAMPLEKIVNLIDSGDVKGLTQLPKVGKKTAEQIILSLKGKLVISEGSTKKFSTKKDIVSALVNLGFRLQDVEWAVDQLDEKVSVQEGVRESLAQLSR